MREWAFDNGINVYEKESYYSIHCFDVYYKDKYLGTIYPSSIESVESCMMGLDRGEDPITHKWQDGFGNVCTLDGWKNRMPCVANL